MKMARRSWRLVSCDSGLLGFAGLRNEVDIQAGYKCRQFVVVAFPKYPFVLENRRDVICGKRTHRYERVDVNILENPSVVVARVDMIAGIHHGSPFSQLPAGGEIR